MPEPAAPSASDTDRVALSCGEADFASRHIGPAPHEVAPMLETIQQDSLEKLIDTAVPPAIRIQAPLALDPGLSEAAALERLHKIMTKNEVRESYIGMGYSGTHTPSVVRRNILENPGWYTAYTPYQAEIAQGRLEALLNFQTLVVELTGMDIANSSLLDEATAAAEGMALAYQVTRRKRSVFLVSDQVHPQTIGVLQTRAEPLGIELRIQSDETLKANEEVFGVLVQYPSTTGAFQDWTSFISDCHEAGALAIVATDLLALTLLRPPGEMGADICIGSAQRFGVPLGYGGPHAAFFATREAHKRLMPGRLVGVSKDSQGRPAYRLSLQTREQHIRREKATSNICTAQVLLAVMASMYAVYHGPEGLIGIARRVHGKACELAAALKAAGYQLSNDSWFDTLTVVPQNAAALQQRAEAAGLNLRWYPDGRCGVALDEVTGSLQPLYDLFQIQAPETAHPSPIAGGVLARTGSILDQPVFHQYRTETEFMRYLKRLENKDLSLTTSMIPLGSCTMKLNAATEMLPVTWPEVGGIHPFAPKSQAGGFQQLADELEQWLAEITGFAAVSLQPNAGSQGEYAGLLAIRRFHLSRGDHDRDVCLIPTSAHGTNPASAAMTGMKVAPVKCDDAGNISVEDLKKKIEANPDKIAALMVTYPSTHGVFEDTIVDVCQLVHEAGGRVYLDGANMNALVGLCRPGDFGADVCHLNLHKTFCIPHGGGGPGIGPIGVTSELQPFLPGDPLDPESGAVSAAPLGSASILVISWLYIAMMGGEGLRHATEIAILNANYIAARLRPFYKILYTGKEDLSAHECILDLRDWKTLAGLEVEDVAKRLMDYGFHAPTMSWPVAGTLMVEPTESESMAELDRFCDAMIGIHGEMQAIRNGEADPEDNVLKNSPHPHTKVCGDDWSHPYTRESAAYPAPWLKEYKFWPAVGRIDNVFGDRNLMCLCPSVEELAEA